ncbi:hypothetical protein GEV33_000395 [Tenebrio molitor]|uniref:Uncharacterized protein n=1 Tax=Tenebrio molitor TaxID=7067 RepID=A0A8J6LR11_TENMO|nr:hypothetical protein GEV33_000395 [Tenebrio molitor]
MSIFEFWEVGWECGRSLSRFFFFHRFGSVSKSERSRGQHLGVTRVSSSQGTKVVFSDVVSSRLRTWRTVAWSSAWCAGGPGRKRENRDLRAVHATKKTFHRDVVPFGKLNRFLTKSTVFEFCNSGERTHDHQCGTGAKSAPTVSSGYFELDPPMLTVFRQRLHSRTWVISFAILWEDGRASGGLSRGSHTIKALRSKPQISGQSSNRVNLHKCLLFQAAISTWLSVPSDTQQGVWESFVILCLGFQVLNNFAYDPSDRVSLAGLQTARSVPETWGFTPNRIIFWTFILQGNLTPWSSLLRWGVHQFSLSVHVPGESQGDSDRVNLQGRRDDVVEFTRAVGDDSSKYHRPHRQADHGLHYGRFQTERFCGSGSRRVLSVQVVPGLTGRCRIYPPASQEQW